MKKNIIAIAFAFLLINCTTSINLRVLKPARVTIKQHIQKIAIINRTKPTSIAQTIIEGVLTGETPIQDASASLEAISGIVNSLNRSDRFKIVNTGAIMDGSATGGSFPSPLKWNQVKNLCNKYNVEAILALEVMDSDFKVHHSNKMVTKKSKDGNSYKEKIFVAKGIATVKVGFRIYDFKNRKILDQNFYTRTKSWEGQASNKHKAIANLIHRDTAIKKASYALGFNYGDMLTPTYVNAKRMMYKKSKYDSNIAIGARKAQVNDWEGASLVWEKATHCSDTKTAGKACFNLALAHEVLGNLEEAKGWAQKAYTDYGIDDARTYVRKIERRLSDEQKLQEQMEEG